MKLTGLEEEEEPITPTDAKPDLSKLRLIRESELRKGGIIGSGAFGTVYKVRYLFDHAALLLDVARKCRSLGATLGHPPLPELVRCHAIVVLWPFLGSVASTRRERKDSGGYQGATGGHDAR